MTHLPPSRHPAPGNGEYPPAGISPLAQVSRPSSPGAEGAERGQSLTEFFADALDGAMSLVHAEGGEIVTLDPSRQVMVLRARRTHPRLDAMGAAARQSQPLPGRVPLPGQSLGSSAPGLGAAGSASGVNPFSAAISGIHAADGELDEIAVQSTQLLPAALRTRTYRRGERLIGHCWERREPVIMKGEDVKQLPGGGAPPDPDAPWHLAVPIMRPGPLSTVRPQTEVIGVFAVYIRDPLWSFTPRDVELLTLHADRVARAMGAADLARQSAGQVDLLSLLGAEPAGSQPQSIYASLRDAVRRLIDAPSFAIVLLAGQADVTFELAERDNRPLPVGRFPASALPPWWRIVQQRRTLCVSAPEDRAAHPELCVLGWGDGQPVQSLLAAPLTYGSTLLGAIVLGSPRPDAYAPEHERLLAVLARSAAILIQNARLASESSQYHARAHEKEVQLAQLNNAVLALNASLDLDVTLDTLVRHAKDLTTDLTSAGVCSAFLLEGDQLAGKAASRDSSKHSESLHGVRIPRAWRDLGRLVIEEGQQVVLDDLELEWQADTEIARLLRADQVRSALFVPISHTETVRRSDARGSGAASDAPGEKRIGCLVVYTPGERRHFWPDEITLLSALASQAGGAINNARLYYELQRAYEEQKVLDRLKEDFILQVSHEFRTPITSIEGYVTLITRHGNKLDQDKLNQFANEIHQSANQLMGMINRLHDASAIDAQPLSVACIPVSIRACAEQATADLPPEGKARVDVGLDRDLWVTGDPERLKAVFSNLLSNALKYTRGACQITVEPRSREMLAREGRAHALAAGAPEAWLVVGVQDTSDGIAAEDQAKLFQKFVRLPRSLTTAVRGTGLGLWICRQYLDAMGGDIWVESALGKGSHFRFCLPLAARPAEGRG